MLMLEGLDTSLEIIFKRVVFCPQFFDLSLLQLHAQSQSRLGFLAFLPVLLHLTLHDATQVFHKGLHLLRVYVPRVVAVVLPEEVIELLR